MFNFFIPTKTKHKDLKTIQNRIDGVNSKLKQKAALYWVRSKGMSDPKTEGYVGVTTKDNLENRLAEHKKNFIEAGFMTAEETNELEIVDLMTGTYGEMNAQEGVFRPYLGIGWNYLNGGGAVFGMSYLNPRNWTTWSLAI